MRIKTLAAAAALLAASELAAATATYTYVVRTDNTVAIIGYAKSTKGAVSVPSTVDGKKVAALLGAFNGCKKVTSVTIPASVNEIGSSTFQGTSSLKTLTFANGSAGVDIGAYAFKSSKLKSLVLPANSTVDDYAFYDSKVTTLEVLDKDPSTNLSNIDQFLSPYNSAGTKLMSDIKKLVVPNGCTANYIPYLSQFMYGRKAKNRGTVTAQYPRVHAVQGYNQTGSTPLGFTSGYFKVNGKKVANGYPVKPGTAKVQFVAAPTASYAPQKVFQTNENETSKAYPSSDYTSSYTFTMPSGDVFYSATFIPCSDDESAINSVAATVQSKATTYATKGIPLASDMQLFKKSALKTKTSISFKGLPSGLSLVLKDDGYYYITGTPATAVSVTDCPAFIVLKGSSGYSRTVPVKLDVSGSSASGQLSTGLSFSTALPQKYDSSSRSVSVLAGLSYAHGSDPVQLSLLSTSTKAKVKASGLPAGIKLVKQNSLSYSLGGRPTKPGTYVATVTVTLGKKVDTYRFSYSVKPNPLEGSYRGYVSSYALGCGATTMSVAADGKATLTFTEGSKKTKVTAYPSLDAGTTWDASSPLVGRFRYSFSVPADKKRKVGKRTLKLAFVTDATSGVSGSARVRQGPLSGFSLTCNDGKARGLAETLRLFPAYSTAQLKETSFYKTSSYRRDYGGFSLLIGPTSETSIGEAFWATAAFNYDKGKVSLNGRLPLGKTFSASVPFVASIHASDTWAFSDTPSYRAIEAAPLVVTDADGTVYVIKIPTDPSEFFKNESATHECVGVFAWNWYGTALLDRLDGLYKYCNRKGMTTPDKILPTSPKVKYTFSDSTWTAAMSHLAAVDSTTISVSSGAKLSYTFNANTGLWTFPFSFGGLTYKFEGVPTSASSFHGTISRTSNNKTYLWGAAKVE